MFLNIINVSTDKIFISFEDRTFIQKSNFGSDILLLTMQVHQAAFKILFHYFDTFGFYVFHQC